MSLGEHSHTEKENGQTFVQARNTAVNIIFSKCFFNNVVQILKASSFVCAVCRADRACHSKKLAIFPLSRVYEFAGG